MTGDSLFPASPIPDQEPRRRGRSVSRADAEVRAGRTQRSALWAAYGDALGWISELTDEAGLRRRTRGGDLRVPISWKRHIGGRGGVNVVLPAGCYSDDTQLRLSTARAISHRGFDVEAFAKVELPVWLAYALGGGTSTKAAAANLAKPTTSWFSNNYRRWLDSGGNGAAMRIQPHVWAAAKVGDPTQYLLDVLRNSICTHAHPVGLVGAVVHSVALGHTMHAGEVPDPDVLAGLLDTVAAVPSLMREDAEVGQYWLGLWERDADQAFDAAWKLTVQDASELIAIAAAAAKKGAPQERYSRVVEALQLREPDRRGSGLLTAIAAVALVWCEDRPTEAMVLAANALDTDTDTIATMAGALQGAVSDHDPPVDVMDADLIRAEATRLSAIASGEKRGLRQYGYPDLLTWSPPKTQADALVSSPDGSLHVTGLGPVEREIGAPVSAAQGNFLWQWVVISVGQTLCIKRRTDLAIVHPHVSPAVETGPEPSDSNGIEEMAVLDEHGKTLADAGPRIEHGRRRREDRSTSPEYSMSDDASRGRPLEVDRVLAFVEREKLDNRAIGYALRRVAREGTTEQIAAFLAALLVRLRS